MFICFKLYLCVSEEDNCAVITRVSESEDNTKQRGKLSGNDYITSLLQFTTTSSLPSDEKLQLFSCKLENNNNHNNLYTIQNIK